MVLKQAEQRIMKIGSFLKELLKIKRNITVPKHGKLSLLEVPVRLFADDFLYTVCQDLFIIATDKYR